MQRTKERTKTDKYWTKAERGNGHQSKNMLNMLLNFYKGPELLLGRDHICGRVEACELPQMAFSAHGCYSQVSVTIRSQVLPGASLHTKGQVYSQ